MAFSKGRLTAITRHGQSVDYRYDRFGRITQDGALTYAHDPNGNRTEIGYPGGVTATYGYDFADRQATLDVQVGADPVQLMVTASSYLPSGPLASLALGNGAPLGEVEGLPGTVRVRGGDLTFSWGRLRIS